MSANPVQRLFAWKIRGIRWIEIIGFALVGAMVFSVYIAKAAAARESAEIGRLDHQIAETRQRVRLLRAEAARLEQPARLETLSRGAGLGPVDVKRQTDEAALPTLKPVPAPVAVAAPPAPVAADTDVVADPAIDPSTPPEAGR